MSFAIDFCPSGCDRDIVRLERENITLKKKLQSFPWQRDFKALTVVFHEEITDNERSRDESIDR